MIAHPRRGEDAEWRAFAGLLEHLLESGEVRVLIEQPQQAIRAVEDMIGVATNDCAGATRRPRFMLADCRMRTKAGELVE